MIDNIATVAQLQVNPAIAIIALVFLKDSLDIRFQCFVFVLFRQLFELVIVGGTS